MILKSFGTIIIQLYYARSHSIPLCVSLLLSASVPSNLITLYVLVLFFVYVQIDGRHCTHPTARIDRTRSATLEARQSAEIVQFEDQK